MNIEKLDHNMRSDVKFDVMGNPIRVGDVVYVAGRRVIRVGVVCNICKTGVSILNDGSYPMKAILKANYIIPEEEIEKLTNDMTDYEKRKLHPTISKVLPIAWRDRKSKKVGIGFIGAKEENKNIRSSFEKTMNENSDKYDIYPLIVDFTKEGEVLKHDSIFSSEPNELPRYPKSFSGIYVFDSGLHLFELLSDEDANSIHRESTKSNFPPLMAIKSVDPKFETLRYLFVDYSYKETYTEKYTWINSINFFRKEAEGMINYWTKTDEINELVEGCYSDGIISFFKNCFRATLKNYTDDYWKDYEVSISSLEDTVKKIKEFVENLRD